MAKHEYEADRQSGAGNCTCGAAKEHVRHPHEYRKAAYRDTDMCVCSRVSSDPIHEVQS